MTRLRPFALALALGVSAGAAAIVAAPHAWAQGSAKATVDAAKASGQVGEQADGFLGVVGGADAATRAAVAEINAGRAGAYRAAAAAAGTTVSAAGEAAYRQLLARMAPGQFYRPSGGGWTRK